MSNEKLTALLESAAGDDAVRKQVEAAGDWEQLKAVAARLGHDLGDLSEAEAMRTIEAAARSAVEANRGELTEAEIEQIAGGVHVIQQASAAVTPGSTDLRGVIYSVQNLFAVRSRFR